MWLCVYNVIQIVFNDFIIIISKTVYLNFCIRLFWLLPCILYIILYTYCSFLVYILYTYYTKTFCFQNSRVWLFFTLVRSFDESHDETQCEINVKSILRDFLRYVRVYASEANIFRCLKAHLGLIPQLLTRCVYACVYSVYFFGKLS